MTGKEDNKKEKMATLSSSQELFEKIFKQATMELKGQKLEGGPDPQSTPKPKPSPGQRQQKASPPVAGEKGAGHVSRSEGPSRTDGVKAKGPTERRGSPQGPSEGIEAPPPPKPKADQRAGVGNGSWKLKATLLLLLFMLLAGFLLNHFALIDLAALPDLLGLGPKQVAQAPAPEKQKARPPEKTAPPPSQPQGPEKSSAASTPPGASAPPPLSKEEKLVELETPTTAQQPPAARAAEERAPSAPVQVKPAPAQVAAKEESQTAPTQTQVRQEPPAPAVPAPKPALSQYPYSAYLGSFKAPEAVRKALSDYQEKGLSAYWARVDLGEKGVWFRFFAGHFRTKEEAEKFIKERGLQEASPGTTKYANLIGVYPSDKDIEAQKRALMAGGFCPYVIKDAHGNSLIYSGAFDRKEYAEKEQSALASKGFQSTVVER